MFYIDYPSVSDIRFRNRRTAVECALRYYLSPGLIRVSLVKPW